MSTRTQTPLEKQTSERHVPKLLFREGEFEAALAETIREEIEQGKRSLDKNGKPVMIVFPSNDL